MKDKCVVLNAKKMNFDGALDFSVLSSDITVYDDTEKEQLLERIQGADIIVTKEMPVSGDMIKMFPESVKLICEAGTGYNNIDLDAARNKGIEASGGEFICFADSDDTVSENFIEVLLSLYNDNVMPVIDVMRSDKAGSALLTIAQSCKLEEDWEEKYFCGDLGQKIAFSVYEKS